MCLAIPGHIVSIDASDPAQPLAQVDFEGRLKPVSLLYVPEAAVGDYVIVQSGFATRRVDEAEALEALAFARETTTEGVRRSPGTDLPAPTVARGRA